MAPDMVKMLRDLADAYEKEARLEQEGESTKAIEERIERLEQGVKGADRADVEDAIEELSEDEWELVQQHRAAGAAKPKPKAKAKVEEEERPRRTRPGRKSGSAYQFHVDDDGRVHRTDIAHIYNGEDEPDEVELPDDDEHEAA